MDKKMKIRQHDIDECNLLYPGADPYELLALSWQQSKDRFKIQREGQVLFVGGVTPMADGVGFCIWGIGTEAMDELKNQLYVLKEGRKLIKELVSKYYRLSNNCSSDPGQVRAMELLGFTVKPTKDPKIKYIEVTV